MTRNYRFKAVIMKKYTTDLLKLKKEVKIEFYKSSGPGGQHKNKTETAVRIRHIPSGIVVTCSDTRSQAQNRHKALQRLSERLAKLNRPKKRRIKTKPTRSSHEKRLQEKEIRSRKKKLRKKVENE